MVESEHKEDRIPPLIEGAQSEYLVEFGIGEMGIIGLLERGKVSFFCFLELSEYGGVRGEGVLVGDHGK